MEATTSLTQGAVPPAAASTVSESAPPPPWRPTAIHAPSHAPIVWPHWPPAALIDLEGPATKFYANLDAVAALRALEADARLPTPDERAALLRFTGWGGIPASFNLDGQDPAWKRRAQHLLDALGPAEYESAKASVNNSHYTEPFVIRWIWAALPPWLRRWTHPRSEQRRRSLPRLHAAGCRRAKPHHRGRTRRCGRTHPEGAVRPARRRCPHSGARIRHAGRRQLRSDGLERSVRQLPGQRCKARSRGWRPPSDSARRPNAPTKALAGAEIAGPLAAMKCRSDRRTTASDWVPTVEFGSRMSLATDTGHPGIRDRQCGGPLHPGT
jgi:hypothetical protein